MVFTTTLSGHRKRPRSRRETAKKRLGHGRNYVVSRLVSPQSVSSYYGTFFRSHSVVRRASFTLVYFSYGWSYHFQVKRFLTHRCVTLMIILLEHPWFESHSWSTRPEPAVQQNQDHLFVSQETYNKSPSISETFSAIFQRYFFPMVLCN